MKRFLYLPAALLLMSNFVAAQANLQNNGGLFLTGTTDTLFISGNLVNASTASLLNNGIVQVKRNLQNDQASMATGSGTLYLNGSVAQVVSGAQVFKTNNLFTNNTAGFTLNNNLSVSGQHSFVNGLITTAATPNYLIYTAGAAYTGATDAAHVNGWVKKQGNTAFIFPVGNATYLRPIELNTLTAVSDFNVLYNNGPTPNRHALFGPLVLVDTAEYWTINKISGSAAKVAFNWDNSKIPFPLLGLNGIRAGYYNGTYWTNIGGTATGNPVTTGNITSSSVSAFNNYFVIASTAFVLSGEISFSGASFANYNRLTWKVRAELNLQQYELQRSNYGLNFSTIHKRYPYNINTDVSYSYDDNTAPSGVVYYRLKITEKDGAVAYTSIVKLGAAGKDGALYLASNPVKDKLELFAGAGLMESYDYSIINPGGQALQQGTLQINGASIQNIPLKTYLPAGTYMLVLHNNHQSWTLRFVKQ